MINWRRFPLLVPLLRLVNRGHEHLRQTEHLYMVLVSIAIGLLGGLGTVGFRECIRLFQSVAWQADPISLDYLRSLPAWWKVLTPATGGLVVGLIISRFAAEAKGHGVPEVMESVALRGGRIRPRVVLAKLLASGVCIASGGSVGREGPIVQIGTALVLSSRLLWKAWARAPAKPLPHFGHHASTCPRGWRRRSAALDDAGLDHPWPRRMRRQPSPLSGSANTSPRRISRLHQIPRVGTRRGCMRRSMSTATQPPAQRVERAR